MGALATEIPAHVFLVKGEVGGGGGGGGRGVFVCTCMHIIIPCVDPHQWNWQ